MQLDYEAFGVQTSRTLERAYVVARFVLLDPLEPHHATAFGARRVIQIIDKPFHREIKAQEHSACRLSNLFAASRKNWLKDLLCRPDVRRSAGLLGSGPIKGVGTRLASRILDGAARVG